MNVEFTAALKAAMRIQQAMLEMSSLGTGSSLLNAKVTLDQMRVDHKAIGAFLDHVEQRIR